MWVMLIGGLVRFWGGCDVMGKNNIGGQGRRRRRGKGGETHTTGI